MKFNEDSRVKIPAILHLTRLGYTYLSLKGLDWDESSNIVPAIFRKSVSSLNPNATSVDIENALGQLGLLLDNEDLGKHFYEQITQTSGLKIIDFEEFNRNTFHVVTEFTCKKDDEELPSNKAEEWLRQEGYNGPSVNRILWEREIYGFRHELLA